MGSVFVSLIWSALFFFFVKSIIELESVCGRGITDGITKS